MRHYKRWHHHFSQVVAFTAVLSFLVAVSGILDIPNTATVSGSTMYAQATPLGAEPNSIRFSYPESTDVGNLRSVLFSEPRVAKDSGLGDQSLPAHTAHCPRNRA